MIKSIKVLPKEGFFNYTKGKLLLCSEQKEKAIKSLKTNNKLVDKEVDSKHIDMIKKLLILYLVLISVNTFAKIGDNNDYWIISQNNYNEIISKGKGVLLRRYIIVPSIDKKYKNIFETRDEKSLLAKFSFMLNRNKASWIDKYIKNCNNSLDINNLIKGLYYFSKKRYYQVIAHLEKIENSEYKFLQFLIIADCKYEMLQDKKNYKTIIGAYQIALDSTDFEQNKAIIKTRIKYIKYQ